MARPDSMASGGGCVRAVTQMRRVCQMPPLPLSSWLPLTCASRSSTRALFAFNSASTATRSRCSASSSARSFTARWACSST